MSTDEDYLGALCGDGHSILQLQSRGLTPPSPVASLEEFARQFGGSSVRIAALATSALAFYPLSGTEGRDFCSWCRETVDLLRGASICLEAGIWPGSTAPAGSVIPAHVLRASLRDWLNERMEGLWRESGGDVYALSAAPLVSLLAMAVPLAILENNLTGDRLVLTIEALTRQLATHHEQAEMLRVALDSIARWTRQGGGVAAEVGTIVESWSFS